MRILVVDDRIQSRWAIADWLSALVRAVSIESAASAPEALAACAKRKPDLVLAAHPMLDMGGLGLARHLKSRGDPPLVVIMTERSDAQFESACDAAGADFWLEKRQLDARLPVFLQQRFSL
ncbi:MAG TPA: response regulator [Burkholderiales bacterium]|nr:response regulator [Burkholderiales bacterium]